MQYCTSGCTSYNDVQQTIKHGFSEKQTRNVEKNQLLLTAVEWKTKTVLLFHGAKIVWEVGSWGRVSNIPYGKEHVQRGSGLPFLELKPLEFLEASWFTWAFFPTCWLRGIYASTLSPACPGSNPGTGQTKAELAARHIRYGTCWTVFKLPCFIYEPQTV